MKNIFRIVVVVLLFFLMLSCEDNPAPALPTITTKAVMDLSYTTATSGGYMINDGGSPVTAIGICWSESVEPSVVNNKTVDTVISGQFTSYLTQLIPNTLYYVRAYATNSAGTRYGSQIPFYTLQLGVPVLTTTAITSVTQTTAVSGGDIIDDGGAPVTARGVCWGYYAYPSITDNITMDGTGTGIFMSSIKGLAPNTRYCVRAYATNSEGTGYSANNISFITPTYAMLFNPNLTYGSVTDIDGNVYRTITIGTQTWMAENLKTTKYNGGENIDYLWYNNDETTYKAAYGALYSGYAVKSGSLCPVGWHIPTDSEWTTLTSYLGGDSVSGGKLKEAGTTHWASPNTGATNESGFTALPGGMIDRSDFYGLGLFGFWWSSTTLTFNQFTDPFSLGGLSINAVNSIVVHGGGNKQRYNSVRCLKDN
jgi:uncharacterized protein (TIGR02145 family)